MLKYLNTQVVFQEFPGETTFAINLTNCPNHCPGCHSPQLWEDIGTELTPVELVRLVEPVLSGITCIGFMGGDGNVPELLKLARFCKANYPDIKIGWYSGRTNWNTTIMEPFDYCKFGPYMVDRGGLDNPNTNQVIFKHIYNGIGPQDSTFDMWLNITKYFWKDTPDGEKKFFCRVNYGMIANMRNVICQTSLCSMYGLTTDGYETKSELPTEENWVKGTVMKINGQIPPHECEIREYRRKVGEKEWEECKIDVKI